MLFEISSHLLMQHKGKAFTNNISFGGVFFCKYNPQPILIYDNNYLFLRKFKTHRT